MSSQTHYLHLKLPNGSKYWNYDTWCENMKILDEAAHNIQTIILDNLQAHNVYYDNTTSGLSADDVQEALDNIDIYGSWVKFEDVNSPTNFEINVRGCCHLTLAFGSTVPAVSFTNRSSLPFTWINGYPTFEANSVYELNFLDLQCIWVKRQDWDWTLFFEYYIENNEFHITRIKTDVWYQYFGNYDFIIPSFVDAMPVILHA